MYLPTQIVFRDLFKDQKEHTLDVLFSQIIRMAGECENCGATDNLQCAHIQSRRFKNIRWDIANAFCLCGECHEFYTKNPKSWKHWVVSKIGEDNWDFLEDKANISLTDDLSDIYSRLLPAVI